MAGLSILQMPVDFEVPNRKIIQITPDGFGTVIGGEIWDLPSEPFFAPSAPEIRASIDPVGENVEPVGWSINDARQVAGVVYLGSEKDAQRRAFRWDETDGYEELPLLREGDVEGFAWDITADGATIVGRSSAVLVENPLFDVLTDIDSAAFIWTRDRGMMDLREILTRDFGMTEQLKGWTLKAARGITPDGAFVVGAAQHDDGRYQGFKASLTFDGPPGDTDFDGDVDLTDFAALKTNFGAGERGAPAFRNQGNFNADATVDLADFELLKANFGAQQPINAAVPEPNAVGLAVLAFVVLFTRRSS